MKRDFWNKIFQNMKYILEHIVLKQIFQLFWTSLWEWFFKKLLYEMCSEFRNKRNIIWKKKLFGVSSFNIFSLLKGILIFSWYYWVQKEIWRNRGNNCLFFNHIGPFKLPGVDFALKRAIGNWVLFKWIYTLEFLPAPLYIFPLHFRINLKMIFELCNF